MFVSLVISNWLDKIRNKGFFWLQPFWYSSQKLKLHDILLITQKWRDWSIHTQLLLLQHVRPIAVAPCGGRATLNQQALSTRQLWQMVSIPKNGRRRAEVKRLCFYFFPCFCAATTPKEMNANIKGIIKRSVRGWGTCRAHFNQHVHVRARELGEWEERAEGGKRKKGEKE